jgi:hypothetical protein
MFIVFFLCNLVLLFILLVLNLTLNYKKYNIEKFIQNKDIIRYYVKIKKLWLYFIANKYLKFFLQTRFFKSRKYNIHIRKFIID